MSGGCQASGATTSIRWDPSSSEDLDLWLKKYQPSKTSAPPDGWIWVEGANAERSAAYNHPDVEERNRTLDQARNAISAACKELDRIKDDDAIPVRPTKAKGPSKKYHRDQVEDRLGTTLMELGSQSDQWRIGKWMLFERESYVDSVFAKLARSIVSGALAGLDGPIVTSIKAESAYPKSKHSEHSGSGGGSGGRRKHEGKDERYYLICVYFESCWNSQHTRSVLETIAREHGIIPSSCKADLYTEAGITSKHPSGLRSSLFTSTDFLSKAKQWALRKEYNARVKATQDEDRQNRSVAVGGDGDDDDNDFVAGSSQRVKTEMPAVPIVVETDGRAAIAIGDAKQVDEGTVQTRVQQRVAEGAAHPEKKPVAGPIEGEHESAEDPTRQRRDPGDKLRSAGPSPEAMRMAAIKRGAQIGGMETITKDENKGPIQPPSVSTAFTPIVPQGDDESSDEEMVLHQGPPLPPARQPVQVPTDDTARPSVDQAPELEKAAEDVVRPGSDIGDVVESDTAAGTKKADREENTAETTETTTGEVAGELGGGRVVGSHAVDEKAADKKASVDGQANRDAPMTRDDKAGAGDDAAEDKKIRVSAIEEKARGGEEGPEKLSLEEDGGTEGGVEKAADTKVDDEKTDESEPGTEVSMSENADAEAGGSVGRAEAVAAAISVEVLTVEVGVPEIGAINSPLDESAAKLVEGEGDVGRDEEQEMSTLVAVDQAEELVATCADGEGEAEIGDEGAPPAGNLEGEGVATLAMAAHKETSSDQFDDAEADVQTDEAPHGVPHKRSVDDVVNLATDGVFEGGPDEDQGDKVASKKRRSSDDIDVSTAAAAASAYQRADTDDEGFTSAPATMETQS